MATMLVASLADANAAVRMEAVLGLGRLLSQPQHAAAWHVVAKLHMARRSARYARPHPMLTSARCTFVLRLARVGWGGRVAHAANRVQAAPRPQAESPSIMPSMSNP